jgi:hypothetical protein
MFVPVLPRPALQCTAIAPFSFSHSCRNDWLGEDEKEREFREEMMGGEEERRGEERRGEWKVLRQDELLGEKRGKNGEEQRRKRVGKDVREDNT